MVQTPARTPAKLGDDGVAVAKHVDIEIDMRAGLRLVLVLEMSKTSDVHTSLDIYI